MQGVKGIGPGPARETGCFKLGFTGDTVYFGNAAFDCFLGQAAFKGRYFFACRLNGKGTHPLQHGIDFAQGILNGFHQLDRGAGIINKAVQLVNAGRSFLGGRKALFAPGLTGRIAGSCIRLAGRVCLLRLTVLLAVCVEQIYFANNSDGPDAPSLFKGA